MKTFFKKLLIIGVILVLALSTVLLCACNSGDNFRNPRNGEPETGAFYTLQTAFDNGWISRGDLRNMAYYHNGDAQKKGFKPTPKNPETLSAETELAIKEAYFSRTTDNWHTLDNLTIEKYYGTYDGFVAIMIGEVVYFVLCEETIGGVTFKYKDTNIILLWKQ